MLKGKKGHEISRRNTKIARAAVYAKMEQLKPREVAVKAFKHKPYGIGGVQNELGRQGTEEKSNSQDD